MVGLYAEYECMGDDLGKLKRKSRASARAAGMLACGLLLASCGGGGGGGGPSGFGLPLFSPPATLVSAVVLAGGGSPGPGDRLQFLLSRNVSLLAGRLLDDADLSIVGGLLGTVTSPPSQVHARLIEVVLGVGAVIQPGVTSIEFAADQDAVVDASGALAIADVPRLVSAGDAESPQLLAITLNGIHSLLNGQGPAGGVLQVPSQNFSIDLQFADASTAVQGQRSVIVANRGVAVNGQELVAGVDLTSALLVQAGSTTASYTVPAQVTFPQGAVSITCYVVDDSGRVSHGLSFDFLVREFTDALRPFETSLYPSQLWYLDISRDVESYSVNLANFSTPVQVQTGASGTADLQELLLLMGLMSPSPLPNVIGAADSNQVVLDRFKAAVLAELQDMFAGVNVVYTFNSPGVFPVGQVQVPQTWVGFSQLCLAGSYDSSGSSGVLGLALLDAHNGQQEDNCEENFEGTDRLGVFLHAMINDGFLTVGSSTFRSTFDSFTPSRPGGVPIGEANGDAARLAGSQADLRSGLIDLAIGRLARFTAVVAAHESGHSMGLVQFAPMPNGLYGGDASQGNPNFPGSSSGHIRMPSSVFPGISINIMAPALDFRSTLVQGTAFNTLNLAYLREQVVPN